MTIQKPSPGLNRDTQRLLELLDELLSHADIVDHVGNRSANTVLLSDKEGSELALLFDRLLESRDFIETLYFVDQLYGRSEPDLNALKTIFVAASKRKGRPVNIQSTLKWQQFMIRLGVKLPMWPNHNIRPMPFDYFLRMERQLLEYLRLNDHTCQIMMKIVERGRERQEQIRKFNFDEIRGERLDRLYEPQSSLLARVRKRAREIFSDTIRRDVSAEQLGGLAIIVSNSAVMFTTRDWGVAGTISTMSGAVPLTLIK